MDPERWKRIDRIFKQALSRPPESLASFLEEACAGDEELRLEVESLIGHDRQVGSLIASPAAELPHLDLAGRSILHYRVLEKIGEGGMGVVYRAHDTRLNRDVAIKLLPEALVADPERKARLEREARLLATLSHPNVAAIYGLEESDGRQYLVLEYVEGRTLADRIGKGRIPLEETLDICRQIAEGLEAAHEKGIVHRDLKPANVKVTPEGKVKILDFGLAKAFYEQAAVADMVRLPTITNEMTHPGVILGTAAYMSPEQSRGKPVDKRADIWAFGCVLYECLTAKRAFQGESHTDTMAAILKSEPNWTLLPAETPPFVRSLLRQCLQKDPSLRLRDIADACVEMREGLAEPSEAIASAQRFSLGWILSIGTSALVIGVLIGLAVMRHFEPPVQASQPVVRSPIRLEPGRWLDGWRLEPPLGFDQPTRTAMAVSSDGRFIVYSAIVENPGPQVESQLYLRRSDQLEAKPIPGTEGGISPFLSPDDRWVAFWVGNKLMKVAIEGGVPAPLCDAPFSLGASWGHDNRIVLPTSLDSGLFIVSADGGEPEILTTPDKTEGETSHRLPRWLPGGKGVLFTIARGWHDQEPRVALLDLKTLKWGVLIEDAADARYVPTGYLVFLRQGTLMAVPFDIEKLQLTGQPVPAMTHIMQAIGIPWAGWASAAGQYSISDSGSLVYASGGIVPDLENSLVWVDQKGAVQPAAPFKAPFWCPRLSSDGQRIAYICLRREWQAWVYDLNRSTASLVTGEEKTSQVSWSPDGKRAVFNLWKPGQPNLHWQPVDGSSPVERLAESEYGQYPGSFTPDETTLAFVECCRPDTGADILLLDLRSRRVTPFLNSRAFESCPEFSPDGRWLAYTSTESGREEVYVQPFPRPGGKWLISHEGGTEPLWAHNGKQLFYRSIDSQQVWVVDVQDGSSFFPSKPRLLFKAPGFAWGWPVRAWDMSQDGQRFLMVKQDERKPQPVTEMILVQNWFEELKRLCPTGK